METKQASNAEYWVAHYLAEPILDWLRTHPEDPVEPEGALNHVGHPAGWQAMLAALDADDPPPRPPIPEH